jgi:hypothetical protein
MEKIQFLCVLTLSCPLEVEYDLTNFNILYVSKDFLKVSYVGFLHNHSCISWEPNPVLSKQ